jgi:hypothetical protein
VEFSASPFGGMMKRQTHWVARSNTTWLAYGKEAHCATLHEQEAETAAQFLPAPLLRTAFTFDEVTLTGQGTVTPRNYIHRITLIFVSSCN